LYMQQHIMQSAITTTTTTIVTDMMTVKLDDDAGTLAKTQC